MNRFHIIFTLLLLSGFITFSCGDGGGGGDPEPLTFEEIISGSWKMQSVTRDGTDVTADFSGFSVSLSSNGKGSSSGNFSISNSGGIIATSGSYTVNGSSGIQLSDGTSVTLSLSNSNNTLTFSFNNPNNIFSGGRTAGASGNYTVVLNK